LFNIDLALFVKQSVFLNSPSDCEEAGLSNHIHELEPLLGQLQSSSTRLGKCPSLKPNHQHAHAVKFLT
jgi:hypothetical protein